LLKSPISRALLLAGISLLAITPFFWWGSPSGHDFEFHVFSWMEVLGQWKQGIVYPRWAGLAHWGYGEARFLFYPPASWTLGAALGAVLPWAIVPGTYCWIALTLAAASMYRLAREWLPVPDALFAATFYALNPYHLLIIFWRSAYAELLAAPILPLILLCLVKLQEPALAQPDPAAGQESYKPGSYPAFRPTLWLSLLLAAAWLTNAPAAVMIHYSTAGLALLLAACAAHGRSWGSHVWRPLRQTALAIVFGISLAGFYLLPTIYEQKWIDLTQVMAPGVRPQDNFLFTHTADADHNRFNLLVSTLAATEVGALALATWLSRRWQSKPTESIGLGSPITLSPPIASELSLPDNHGHESDRPPRILFPVWGAVSALSMLSLSNFFWLHLPKFRFVQLPFRWLLCMNVALAILLTVGAKRWTLRLLTFGVLLLTLVVAGHRIQPPWWDTADDLQEMSNDVTRGAGYEGTDEYVPAGADAYELNKSLSFISDDAGAPVHSDILAWGPKEKHFVVHAPAAQDITVRLFSYPAWQVLVNGKVTTTDKTEVTGLIVIPVDAGDSDIYIVFRRTIDRLVGDIVSLISLLLFVIVWSKVAHKPSSASTTNRPSVAPVKLSSRIS
jgi:hypothetical protein